MTKKQLRFTVENVDLNGMPLTDVIARLEEIQKTYPEATMSVETCQDYCETAAYTIVSVCSYREETDDEYARRQRDETLSAYIKKRDELLTLEALAAKHGRIVT